MKIGKIKIEIKKEEKKIDKLRIARAFSISFFRGEYTLKVNIFGLILVYQDKQIVKIGFLKRRKILEII